MVALEETISVPLTVTEQGLFALKARELVSTQSFIISNLGRQQSKLSKAFLPSASAIFTQVLLTT
jgi:hypothetical protein